QWDRGETCRDLMEDRKWLKTTAPPAGDELSPAEEGGPGKVARDYQVEVSGKRFEVKVIGETAGAVAPAGGARNGRPPKRERKSGGGGGGGPVLESPLQGSVFKVEVESGAEVAEGDLICVIEAMKMENEITAHRAGKVTALPISVGDAVASGDPLVTIE
ncbi:MAG: carbamoyl phosphate synthase, partial [Thermoleophilia bacterium]|nr:carbamoyl phosphate synthase [Thermoleophilia bacterium]